MSTIKGSFLSSDCVCRTTFWRRSVSFCDESCWRSLGSSLAPESFPAHIRAEFRGCQTKAQNDTERLRLDLCRSSGPTPLLKRGHLEQVAQDRVPLGCEYLQGRRLHNLPVRSLSGPLAFLAALLVPCWHKPERKQRSAQLFKG